MKAVGAAVLLTVASLLAKSLVVSGSGDPILLGEIGRRKHSKLGTAAI